MSEVRTTFRLKPGDAAPDFALPDFTAGGASRSLADLMGPNGVLIAFVCNHCPFVVHLADPLASFADEISRHGVSMVAINSNDVENYPQDSPDKMKEFADAHHWSFPYLYDATQEVALAYGAACTPDFFLFDGKRALFYTGQFDGSRPGNGTEPNAADMRDAVERMVSGSAAPEKVYPSSGCNIKWKSGVKPDWWNSGNT